MPQISEERRKTHPLNRRSFLIGAASMGLLAYGGTHGRHELEITHSSLPIRNLPDPFVGFRIVQISDIHLEVFTEAWFLQHVVNTVNQLDPDLILITGDFVSYGLGPLSIALKAAGICAEILSGLKAPHRYACLGNHDTHVGVAQVMRPLEAHGISFLVNSYTAIEKGDSRLWLCGTADAAVAVADLNLAVPARAKDPVLLMCHEPDFADNIVSHPRFPQIDLMLSGHSHGGQVKLPCIGPLVLPRWGKKYPEGLYRFGHMQLYVNRGLGTVGVPLRWNCPPEISHFTLTRA